MSIQAIEVLLSAHFADGRKVTRAEFVDVLGVAEGDGVLEVITDRGLWQTSLLVFSRCRLQDYAQQEDVCDALDTQVQTDLKRMAGWLIAREASFADLRASGLAVDVFVDLRIDQDQLDLSFPPEFLFACGKAGLAIKIVSND